MYRLIALTLILFCSAPAFADCHTSKSYGTIEVQKGQVPHVLGAPHGRFDLHTEKIVAALGKELSWQTVIALDFRQKGRFINVNRPTEGVRLKSGEEQSTERARAVYHCYQRQLESLLSKDAYYIELHGNSRPESAQAIEIASLGTSLKQRANFKQTLMRNLKKEGIPLEIKMEGLDPLHFQHSAARKFGIYKHSIHKSYMLEIPGLYRKKPALRKKLTRALKATIQTEFASNPTKLNSTKKK